MTDFRLLKGGPKVTMIKTSPKEGKRKSILNRHGIFCVWGYHRLADCPGDQYFSEAPLKKGGGKKILIRFLKYILGVGNSVSIGAIPLRKARLCTNCENIVETQICPVCLSKQHVVLGRSLADKGDRIQKEGT